MPRQPYNRRQILQGSFFAAGVVPLCCTSLEVPAESVTFGPNSIVLDLKKAGDVLRTGSAAAVISADRKINLIVAHAAKNRYVALNRSCTHGGAQCTFNAKRQSLQCTSLNHAEYDLNGTLLHGRTHGNLRAYRASLAGSTLTISLEIQA